MTISSKLKCSLCEADLITVEDVERHSQTCSKATTALDVQVGGSHYKNLKIQPVEFIHANGLDYIEGSIVKYISRWRQKNGIEDLKKIKHYVDLLIELETKEQKP